MVLLEKLFKGTNGNFTDQNNQNIIRAIQFVQFKFDFDFSNESDNFNENKPFYILVKKKWFQFLLYEI